MEIDGKSLSLDSIAAALTPETLRRVALADDARTRIETGRRTIEEILQDGRVVYGINTGFGKLARVRIEGDRLDALQRNLLLSHAVGVGPPLDDDVVRLAILLRANALSHGNSGVRPCVVDQLLDLLRHDVVPVIPSQGSVGASGDLAPLAHLALVLIGEGRARYDGSVLPGNEALERAGLTPLRLRAKEGLALINGTQISAAIGATALIAARRLLATADVAAASTLEALRGSIRPFDARVAALRPHPGHGRVAANVRALLKDSEILLSHVDCDRVQDQYSLRCVPQVHGAARDAIDHACSVVERELNAVTDNPLVFPEDADVVSAGNFHAEPLALVYDYAATAVAELANIAERRLENMVNPDLSGLAPFLVKDSGVNSGFMMLQVTAAALVSENKSLAHPASVDSIPTSANKEDHVSMAPIAARKLAAIVENATVVLAIELLAARQALELAATGLRPGRGVATAMEAVAEVVPAIESDRWFAPDIESVIELVRSGEIVERVRRTTPELA